MLYPEKSTLALVPEPAPASDHLEQSENLPQILSLALVVFHQLASATEKPLLRHHSAIAALVASQYDCHRGINQTSEAGIDRGLKLDLSPRMALHQSARLLFRLRRDTDRGQASPQDWNPDP